MTQRISRRTGRKYTEGSQSTLADWEKGLPCYVCGERIVKSRQACGTSFGPPHRAWHFDCAAGPYGARKGVIGV